MYNYKGSEGTNFHHNSDFSGEIIIITKDGQQFEIPGKDILEFVAYNYVRPTKISKIEDMDYKGLLKGSSQ